MKIMSSSIHAHVIQNLHDFLQWNTKGDVFFFVLFFFITMKVDGDLD